MLDGLNIRRKVGNTGMDDLFRDSPVQSISSIGNHGRGSLHDPARGRKDKDRCGYSYPNNQDVRESNSSPSRGELYGRREKLTFGGR